MTSATQFSPPYRSTSAEGFANRVAVNDTHSGLNPTWIRGIVRPRTLGELQAIVRDATRDRYAVSVAGARHAMGAQQFGTDQVLVDMRGLNRVLGLDVDAGVVEAEAGVCWPKLIDYLHELQGDQAGAWSIIQKQTGADRLTLGGAIAANIHGRGLTLKPFINDIEELCIVTAEGEVVICNRRQNADLFGLVVGGYGLIGLVYSVKLRLQRRRKVQRVVTVTTTDTLITEFEERIEAGYFYGDFQYNTDEGSDKFLREGVLSCYRPVPDDTPIPKNQRALGERHWEQLIGLAHVDKGEAYRLYTTHYKATSGQIYWSDTHQLSTYLDHYHDVLDARLQRPCRSSEMITEVYVPRQRLADFMRTAASELRRLGADVIYGTIRLIERDEESFLAWAREPWACVIFNLHVDHLPAEVIASADAFRRLIDLARACGGSYYLTYHKFATLEQLRSCYPQFPEFVAQKRTHDPDDRFQSDWFRWYAKQLDAT